MTHLVVHVGFPKTATTMLQVKVFQNLHRKGHINYIGNSEGFDSKDIKQVDYFVRPLILGSKFTVSLSEVSKKYPLFRGLLREDIPNVLSFEYLTIPGFCDLNPEETARKIRLAFEADDVSFSVVVTLRNHPDLLNSFYAHFLEWSYNHGKIAEIDINSGSADEWLERHVLPSGSYIHKGFDFDYIEKIWGDEFGSRNIRVNLYEDLLDNERKYLTDWASILNLPDDILLDEMSDHNKVRVRSRLAQFYEISVPRFGTYALKAKFHEPAGSFLRALGYKIARIASNRLPRKNMKIASISSGNEAKIFSVFGDSNRALFERHGLCAEKGKSYRYWT